MKCQKMSEILYSPTLPVHRYLILPFVESPIEIIRVRKWRIFPLEKIGSTRNDDLSSTESINRGAAARYNNTRSSDIIWR